jgi:hypothetical protein
MLVVDGQHTGLRPARSTVPRQILVSASSRTILPSSSEGLPLTLAWAVTDTVQGAGDDFGPGHESQSISVTMNLRLG